MSSLFFQVKTTFFLKFWGGWFQFFIFFGWDDHTAGKLAKKREHEAAIPQFLEKQAPHTLSHGKFVLMILPFQVLSLLSCANSQKRAECGN